MTTTFSFNEFSDRELLSEVTRLAASEREATARLVASLAEVDARRLYLSEGCASLFTSPAQHPSRRSQKDRRARLGLIAAEAHRPDLLILDEPSSGLDPIVRRDILEAIIRTVTDEGRTVIFSSHLLDEVERVSDHVAMLHRGTLKLCAPLDDIKTQHRRILLQFTAAHAEPPNVPGAIRVDGAGRVDGDL